MTIKQKQCLLCYLGCYNGAIDGIWGQQSTAATIAFQRSRGLTPDGVFGPTTEAKILTAITGGAKNWWDQIAFFRREEFACKCGHCGGYPTEMEEAVVQAADRVRNHFGRPVIVSSGLRCISHNTNVGGVANSRHLSGKAVDFCVTGKSSGEVLDYVHRQPEIRYAYAIDGQFVHMDIL